MSAKQQELFASSHFNGGNAAYLEALYEEWLENPEVIPDQNRELF